MPLVLAIEPDLRQAAIVKRVVREKIDADVTVVDSRDAAIEAMRAHMPDVLLLSALLSPRDEDELISHLRTLDGSDHLQTHTIPQLASALHGPEDEGGKGLFGMFRRKKEKETVASGGCDPDVFAEEIRTYLKRAEEKKRDRELYAHKRIVIDADTPSAASESAAGEAQSASAESSWADPFAWPAGGAVAATAAPPAAEPQPAFENAAAHVEDVGPTEPAFAGDALPDGPIPDFEPVHVAGFEPLFDGAPAAAPEPPIAIPAAVLAIRDFVDPLCMWARAERQRPDGDRPVAAEDLQAMLTALAVPGAVASVRYPRGCRIRRVAVLPSVEARLTAAL